MTPRPHFKSTALPSIRARVRAGTMPVRDGLDLLLFGLPGDKPASQQPRKETRR